MNVEKMKVDPEDQYGEILGDIEVEPKKKGVPFERHFFIIGFDEYGRYQSEHLIVPPFGQEVHTKLNYAYLGDHLPEDWVVKIGEWFWK